MGFGIKTRLVSGVRYVSRYRLPFLRRLLFSDTSEHGEYLAIKHLLPDSPPFVVEVGANDGCLASNSYPLIRRGWSAILIEPNPEVFKRLQALHGNKPKVQLVNCACGDRSGVLPLYLGHDEGTGGCATLSTESSAWFSAVRTSAAINVPVETLTSVLSDHHCPADFGLLSVDTEGFDQEVLQGLDFSRFSPRIILTEDSKSDDRSADLAKAERLRRHGYLLWRRIYCNDIWIRTESSPGRRSSPAQLCAEMNN